MKQFAKTRPARPSPLPISSRNLPANILASAAARTFAEVSASADACTPPPLADALRLRREDLLGMEPLLAALLRRVLPFASHSLYFPTPANTPESPQWLAKERTLLLPLIRRGEGLGVFTARGVDGRATRRLLPELPALVELCLDNLELERRGRCDALTGLALGRELLGRMTHEADMVRQRFSGGGDDMGPLHRACMGLVVVRCRDWHALAAETSHAFAESLLVELSQALTRDLPPEALAARTGDDEFAVLLSAGSRGACRRVAAALLPRLDAVSQPHPVTRRAVRICCSVGHALYPQDMDVALLPLPMEEQARTLLHKARLAATAAQERFDALLEQDAALGALHAEEGREARAMTFSRVLHEGGVIRRALPLGRAETSLGRHMGACEGLRFAVWSQSAGPHATAHTHTTAHTHSEDPPLPPPSQPLKGTRRCKGEIILIEVREKASIADIIHWADPADGPDKGDMLTLLPQGGRQTQGLTSEEIPPHHTALLLMQNEIAFGVKLSTEQSPEQSTEQSPAQSRNQLPEQISAQLAEQITAQPDEQALQQHTEQTAKLPTEQPAEQTNKLASTLVSELASEQVSIQQVQQLAKELRELSQTQPMRVNTNTLPQTAYAQKDAATLPATPTASSTASSSSSTASPTETTPATDTFIGTFTITATDTATSTDTLPATLCGTQSTALSAAANTPPNPPELLRHGDFVRQLGRHCESRAAFSLVLVRLCNAPLTDDYFGAPASAPNTANTTSDSPLNSQCNSLHNSLSDNLSDSQNDTTTTLESRMFRVHKLCHQHFTQEGAHLMPVLSAHYGQTSLIFLHSAPPAASHAKGTKNARTSRTSKVETPPAHTVYANLCRTAAAEGLDIAVGLAAWPHLRFTRADMPECCRKALDLALLLPEPRVGVFGSLALHISADKRYSRGDIFGAVEEYKLALLADRNNSMAWNSLGVCMAALSRQQEARGHFLKALQGWKRALHTQSPPPFLPADTTLAAEFAATLYNLGTVCQTLGERRTAARHFRQCVDMQPEHYFAHLRLGQLAEEGQRSRKAREHYVHALHLEDSGLQSGGMARRHLARLAVRGRKLSQARELLHEALRRDPHDAAAMGMLAELCLDGGEDPAMAEMLARNCVSLRGAHAPSWRLLARALRALDRHSEADAAEARAGGI